VCTHLLNKRPKRLRPRQPDALKGDTCRLAAAHERRDIIRLRWRDPMCDLFLPCVVCCTRLLDSEFCQVCVEPVACFVAVEEGVAALLFVISRLSVDFLNPGICEWRKRVEGNVHPTSQSHTASRRHYAGPVRGGRGRGVCNLSLVERRRSKTQCSGLGAATVFSGPLDRACRRRGRAGR
jgi:hypothetical protein